MKKKLGCLHAHYSNIEYIEIALSSYDIELVHFVDPALMYRVTSDETFNAADAQMKVKEQIEWIAECHVDAILITCTNYIAIFKKNNFPYQFQLLKLMNLTLNTSVIYNNLRQFYSQILLLLTGQWSVSNNMLIIAKNP